jgi:hypothetical protein
VACRRVSVIELLGFADAPHSRGRPTACIRMTFADHRGRHQARRGTLVELKPPLLGIWATLRAAN